MVVLARTVPLEADVLSARLIEHCDVLFLSVLACLQRGTFAAICRQQPPHDSNVGPPDRWRVKFQAVASSFAELQVLGGADSISIHEVVYWEA